MFVSKPRGMFSYLLDMSHMTIGGFLYFLHWY